MDISDLVKDWGGFEKLVAKLHETGDVTVDHNVKLKGRSGAERQVDVLIRHRQGLYEHLVVAECKYWNNNVERLHVDALATTIREVGASRGVIFSTKGFQSGAITQAVHDNIDLYTVRDLTAEEWGLPGRVVEFYLQLVQLSIGNLNAENTAVAFPLGVAPRPLSLNLKYGLGPESSTPLVNPEENGTSLEARIEAAAQKAMPIFLKTVSTINGGTAGTWYMMGKVNLEPKQPFVVAVEGALIYIPKMTFDLGIKITQSQIRVDRAENYLFALAVENCINGIVSTASRSVNSDHTTLTNAAPPGPQDGDYLKNGSVMRMGLRGFFPFDEMAELTPIPL